MIRFTKYDNEWLGFWSEAQEQAGFVTLDANVYSMLIEAWCEERITAEELRLEIEKICKG